MKQKRKILWVEDEARHDMVQLIAPVIMDGGYDIVVAENASDGIAQLLQYKFEAIIVDIRIPPGDDPAWIDLYEKSGKEKVAARLGRHFLYTILGNPNAKINLGEKRPKWITSEMIGLLTVETDPELADDLKALVLNVYYQKGAETPETILLDIIKEINDQNM